MWESAINLFRRACGLEAPWVLRCEEAGPDHEVETRSRLALPFVIIGRDQTQKSQVIKQADVVALLALLPEEFPGNSAETNFRYYEPLCAHGSSLSAGMHALTAARLGHADTALSYVNEAEATDLDLDPNSAGGVRIAGLGAMWQAVILGFAGLDLKGELLGIDPRLPPQWRSLSFRVCWRGRSVAIRVEAGGANVTLVAGEPMDMRVADTKLRLMPRETQHAPFAEGIKAAVTA